MVNDIMRYDAGVAILGFVYVDVYISIYGVLYEFCGW